MPSSPNPPFTPTRTWRQRSCPHRRKARVTQGHGYAFADDSSTSCLRRSPASTRRSRHVPSTAGEPKSSSSTETGAGDSFGSLRLISESPREMSRCQPARYDQLGRRRPQPESVNRTISEVETFGGRPGRAHLSDTWGSTSSRRTRTTPSSACHRTGSDTVRQRDREPRIDPPTSPPRASLSFALQLERPGQDVAHRRQEFTALIRAQ